MTAVPPPYFTPGLRDAGALGVIATGSTILRSLPDRFADVVNALDYGLPPDGVKDDSPTLRAAILGLGAAGGKVYVPRRAAAWQFNSPVIVTSPVEIIGDGGSATVLERNYSPVADTDGIFNFRDGSSFSGVSHCTLRSKVGQTGGCLVSIVNTVTGTGLYAFEDVDFTTTDASGVTGTHKYTIFLDGTAIVAPPIGLRGVEFRGCSLFGAATQILEMRGVLKLSFMGGGIYTAGGNPAAGANFTGTGTVKTQSFVFHPSDCACPINFDFCTNGVITTGVVGAITNTANATFIFGYANAPSVQNNWTFSAFFNTGNRSWTGTQIFLNPVTLADITTALGASAGASLTVNQNAAAGTNRDRNIQSAGVNVWTERVSGAEGGADAGAQLQLIARTDAGAIIDAVLTIIRAAGGTVTWARPLITVASVAGRAGFNLPHGVAPAAPVNGDLWTTTAGLFARINGVTVGPYT